MCLPSDTLLQHLPSYLGFSYLGRGVSLHSCSSKVQLLLLTLDIEYLLTTALPDLRSGIAPLGPPAMSRNFNKAEEFKFNLQGQNTKSSPQILCSINRMVRANGCQCYPKMHGCVLLSQAYGEKIYESVKVLVGYSCPSLFELIMASVLDTHFHFLSSFSSCFCLCLTCSSLSLSISTLTSFF